MRRNRVGMVGALGVSVFALLYACVGSDPDAVVPAADASITSSSSSTGGSSSSSGTGTSSSGSPAEAGPPVCTSTEELCNGACVATASFATSKDNCGACGHSCGGGECKNAACGPTVVVENIQEQDGFDVMDGYVYFITQDNAHTRADVHRCKTSGCAPEETLFSTSELGTQADGVFATGGVFAFHFLRNQTKGTVKPCPAKKCLNTDLESNAQRRVYGTSGSRFFLAGGINSSSIHMLECHPTDDDAGCTQSPTPLVAKGFASVGIGQKGATDGKHVTYQSAFDGGYDLRLCNVDDGCDGGGTQVVDVAPEHNVITANKLFLMRSGSNVSQPTGGIKVCDLPCTTPPTDFAKSQQNPIDLAADDQAVYWMSPALPAGYDAIVTCPVAGCASGGMKVVSGLGANPRELRVDDGFVYWTSDTTVAAPALNGRDIHRIAKPLAPK